MTQGSGFTVVLAGDTSLGDWYVRRAAPEVQSRLAERPLSFFERLRPLVDGSDLFVANLETVLAEAPTSPFEGQKNYLGWDSPQRTVNTLSQLGVDAVSLANNHTMDFGPDVLAATWKVLSERALASFGAGAGPTEASAPLVRTIAAGGWQARLYILGAVTNSTALREKYGFFADEGRWGLHPLAGRRIAEQIADLRAADPGAVIILYPHWGQNYGWASAGMARDARRYLEAGADMIIGHGAHMCQELTTTPHGSVVYSIGNFVFNSAGRYAAKGAWPYSMVARLTFTPTPKQWQVDMRLYPIVTDNEETGYQARPVNDSEAREVYTGLAARTPAPRAFARNYALERDDRGWHVRQTTAISPRLPTARRVSVAGWWRRRRLITTANGLSATGPSGARESNAATTNEGAATFREGSNNACLAAALDARNIPYTSRKLTIRGRNQRVILCRINDVPYAIAGASIRLFDGNDTARGSIDRRAARFVKQKDKLAEHLTERGFSVPRGTAFDGDEFDTALDYFDTHAGTYMSGFCLKPTNGNMGQHVHTSITSRDGFRAAFADVAGAHDRVLVQEMIPGAVYRMLSVGGTVIAVGTGVPMNVTGNGSSSIKELVEAKQRARRANPAHSRYRFELGDSELAALEANGLSPESIPASDTTVYLSETSNLHRGAEFTDFTDAIDPSHKTEVERAVASIPGLRVCGADVIIRDYAKPAEPDNHVILELNREPGLTGHHYPWSGQSRDAAGAIVNLMRTLTLADHDARK